MGLIIPGFIPSTLHEIVEYTPSLLEWKISAGIWAFGLMVYTLALKIALPIFTGRFSIHTPPGSELVRTPARSDRHPRPVNNHDLVEQVERLL